MTFITGVTNPYYIRNLVYENLLSGESFVRSTLFAHFLIHYIAIASIYVSNHEKFQGTFLFWNDSLLTISISGSTKHCIRNERQRTFLRFASWTVTFSVPYNHTCPSPDSWRQYPQLLNRLEYFDELLHTHWYWQDLDQEIGKWHL